MSDCIFLERENHPEWYYLGYVPGSGSNREPPRLVLGLEKSALGQFMSMLAKNWLLKECEKLLCQYGVEAEFLSDISKPWGFGGALIPDERLPNFLEFRINVPRVEKDTGKPCSSCKGEGEDPDLSNECLRCFGTGKETVHDFAELDRVAATLCVLSPLLDKPFKEWMGGVASTSNQLVTITTNFQRGRAFIGAVLSSEFGASLRRRTNVSLPPVEEAIKEAYLHMFPGYKRFSSYSFRAIIRERGQLSIDVPGDACGLYVDGMSHSLRETEGPIDLDCHNVDGHHQQFTLLVGLATLAGIVRKERRNK